jgi:hypothetical protein
MYSSVASIVADIKTSVLPRSPKSPKTNPTSSQPPSTTSEIKNAIAMLTTPGQSRIEVLTISFT